MDKNEKNMDSEFMGIERIQPEDTSGLHPEDSDQMKFFATGRDFESVYVNHKYTESERKTLSNYESLDYLPPHSKVYCDWLRRQPPRFEWDRWVMMALIGFVVGFIGFLMHQLIDVIAETKWDKATEMIASGNLAIACSFVIGYSVIFVIASTFMIVILRPSASGSGIPELIGYLNGTVIRHIFNMKTMVIKFLSCVCAVGSGLPVGPEGPMIHLGSMIGAGLSQLRSTTLGIELPIFSRFRNSEDRRNFISAGAAAGVSSAFGAPVGGLLFSMEEVSSFWNMKLSWQTFFCCMVSTFTTDLMNSAFTAFHYQGDFGLFKTNKYILFAVTKEIDLNIVGILPAVLIGLLGGIFGSLFTFLNLKIQRARRKLLSRIKASWLQKMLRMFEPVLIMIIFGILTVFIPNAQKCSEYSCSVDKNNKTSNCLFGVNAEENLEIYSCPKPELTTNSYGQLVKNGSYNQVATLLFLTGEDAIAHLFSRNTHFELDIGPLAIVLAIYFICACWAAGSSISSGLVVPMLFIGGLYGRIVGRILVDLFGVHMSGYWAWMDPGAFALLGAASFFGGVSRLTMSLTVIMVELTNDVQFLLLIMTSILVAKWVGDYITHPLYHALLEFKCIPFLDAEPIIIREKTKNISLELFCVKDMMTSPVVMVHTRESVARLADILYNTTNSGFPVIKKMSPANSSTFCGIITRREISVLLMHSQIFESTSENTVDEPEVLDIDYPKFCSSKMEKSERILELLKTYNEKEEFKSLYINIIPYMNRSAPCIHEQFSLHRAYIIFRSLGLRHLTVVNDLNQVTGIITRKDLMGFMLEERLHKVLHGPSGPYNDDNSYKMFDINNDFI